MLVDEAFADAVPGEPESLAGADVPGLLVFRSLTKTWALAGLRAGYALGDPAPARPARRPRPPWPVSTLALEAVAACCTPEAVAAAARAADALVRRRAAQAAALAAVPGVTVLPGRRALPAAAAAGRAGRAGPRRAAGRRRRGAARRHVPGPVGPTTSGSPSAPPRRSQQLVRGLTAALAEVAA